MVMEDLRQNCARYLCEIPEYKKGDYETALTKLFPKLHEKLYEYRGVMPPHDTKNVSGSGPYINCGTTASIALIVFNPEICSFTKLGAEKTTVSSSRVYSKGSSKNIGDISPGLIIYFASVGDSPILKISMRDSLVARYLGSCDTLDDKESRIRIAESKIPIKCYMRCYQNANNGDLRGIESIGSGLRVCGGIGDFIQDPKLFNGIHQVVQDYKSQTEIKDILTFIRINKSEIDDLVFKMILRIHYTIFFREIFLKDGQEPIVSDPLRRVPLITIVKPPLEKPLTFAITSDGVFNPMPTGEKVKLDYKSETLDTVSFLGSNSSSRKTVDFDSLFNYIVKCSKKLDDKSAILFQLIPRCVKRKRKKFI